MKHSKEVLQANRGLWVMVAVLAVVFMLEPYGGGMGTACGEFMQFIRSLGR